MLFGLGDHVKAFVWIDGAFIEEAKASIPITDRGFLFGDGIFSTVRVSNGRIEHLDLHLDHLRAHCHAINLDYPDLKRGRLEELVALNRATHGIWRLKIIVTGGDDSSLHLPKRHGRLIATVKPVNTPKISEARLCIYPIGFSAPLASVKSLSYLDRLHFASYARLQNCDETLVLSQEGYMLEAAFANIFWRERELFYSPARTHSLLIGATLSRLARLHAFHFVEKSPAEIDPSAQVFLCNSIQGIVPVIQIGDRLFERDFTLEVSLDNPL